MRSHRTHIHIERQPDNTGDPGVSKHSRVDNPWIGQDYQSKCVDNHAIGGIIMSSEGGKLIYPDFTFHTFHIGARGFGS